MKNVYIYMFLFLLIDTGYAQPLFNKIYSTNANRSVTFHNVKYTDSILYLSGKSIASSVMDRGYYMRADLQGNKLSESIYGNDTYTQSFINKSMKITADGKIFNSGNHQPNNGNHGFVSRQNVDGSGFVSTTFLNADCIQSLLLSDNTALTLQSAGSSWPDTTASWIELIKTDAACNEVWRKVIYDSLIQAKAIVKGAGDTYYLCNTIQANGRNKLLVIEVDSAGNELQRFKTVLPQGLMYHRGALLNGDNLFIYGYMQYNIGYPIQRGYLAKVNIQTGIITQDSLVGSGDYIPGSHIYDMEILSDGSMIGAGMSSYMGDPSGYYGWLIKFSAQGDSLWSKKYRPLPFFNPEKKLVAFYDIEVLPDGGFLAAGVATGSSSPMSPWDGGWGWVVRLDSSGNGPGEVTADIAQALAQEGSLCAAPNPAKDYTVFHYTLPDFATGYTLRVFDLQGKLLKQLPLSGTKGETIWDVTQVAAGLYTYCIYDAQGHMMRSEKLSIVK